MSPDSELRSTAPINGCVAAPFAPMKKDRSLDLDTSDPYTHHLATTGVAGVFVNGTTGEGTHSRAVTDAPCLRGVKYTHPYLIEYRLCRSLADGRYDLLFGRAAILLAAGASEGGSGRGVLTGTGVGRHPDSYDRLRSVT